MAANPSTPIDVLDAMLQRKAVRLNRVSWLAAANPSLPAERWPEVQHLLGEAWLADYQSCMFWPFMLAHPDCPERRLVRNAISSNWRHRLMVAINPSTPDETLRQLTQEGVRPVRTAARRTLAAKARALDDTTNHETTSKETTR